jgi:hypothetical protein
MADYTNTGFQANVAGHTASGVQVYLNGRWVDSESAEGRDYYQQAQTQYNNDAKNYAAAQNKAEVAKVNQQEVEDRSAENRARNDGMSRMAFGNAQRGNTLGRGLFQRRQAGVKISTGLGALAKANAGEIATARRNTLGATQAADITRSNPQLGYGLALARAQKEMMA